MDWGNVGFALLVGVVAAALMVAHGNVAIAYDDVIEWLLFTLPATALVFGSYVLWVTLEVSWHFAQEKSAFRFEAHERHNFVEEFKAMVNDLPMAPDEPTEHTEAS